MTLKIDSQAPEKVQIERHFPSK